MVQNNTKKPHQYKNNNQQFIPEFKESQDHFHGKEMF